MNGESKYYAKLYKSFMRNKDVSYQAKAVYAYLLCFADRNKTCHPSRLLICDELNITSTTLTKYLNELRDKGFITWETDRSEGKYGHNMYKILK